MMATETRAPATGLDGSFLQGFGPQKVVPRDSMSIRKVNGRFNDMDVQKLPGSL